jgi:hypothetical protein
VSDVPTRASAGVTSAGNTTEFPIMARNLLPYDLTRLCEEPVKY